MDIGGFYKIQKWYSDGKVIADRKALYWDESIFIVCYPFLLNLGLEAATAFTFQTYTLIFCKKSNASYEHLEYHVSGCLKIRESITESKGNIFTVVVHCVKRQKTEF